MAARRRPAEIRASELRPAPHLVFQAPRVAGPELRPRAGHSVTPLSASALLVYGGWCGGTDYLDDMRILEHAHGNAFRWKEPHFRTDGVAEPPCARANHSLTKVSDSILVLFGGTAARRLTPRHEPDEVILGDVRVLSMGASGWHWRAEGGIGGDPPCARGGHTAVEVSGLLVFGGGSGGHVFYNDLHKLHMASSPRWSRLQAQGEPPCARGHHTACVLGADHDLMAVYGGICDGGEQLADVHILAVRAARWEEVELAPSPGGPGPRSSHSAVALPPRPGTDGVMCVFGGRLENVRLNSLCMLSLEPPPPRAHGGARAERRRIRAAWSAEVDAKSAEQRRRDGRASHGLAVLGGQLVSIAGYLGSGQYIVDDGVITAELAAVYALAKSFAASEAPPAQRAAQRAAAAASTRDSPAARGAGPAARAAARPAASARAVPSAAAAAVGNAAPDAQRGAAKRPRRSGRTPSAEDPADTQPGSEDEDDGMAVDGIDEPSSVRAGVEDVAAEAGAGPPEDEEVNARARAACARASKPGGPSRARQAAASPSRRTRDTHSRARAAANGAASAAAPQWGGVDGLDPVLLVPSPTGSPDGAPPGDLVPEAAVRAIEARLATARDAREQLEREVALLRARAAQLERERDDARQQGDERARAIERLSAQAAADTDALHAANRRLDDANHSRTRVSELLDDSKKRNAALVAQLESGQQEISRLTAEASHHRSAVESERALRQADEQRRIDLNLELKAARAELAGLRQSLDDARVRALRLRARALRTRRGGGA